MKKFLSGKCRAEDTIQPITVRRKTTLYFLFISPYRKFSLSGKMHKRAENTAIAMITLNNTVDWHQGQHSKDF
jgi:hypothetical protein